MPDHLAGYIDDLGTFGIILEMGFDSVLAYAVFYHDERSIGSALNFKVCSLCIEGIRE